MAIKNILLIDDDLDEHEFFINAIKQVGDQYSCTAICCGMEALQAIKSFEVKPDIIFLDLNMPGMNAEDFLFGLEAFAPLHAIPVVIYSGYMSPYNISPGWPGVEYHLKKPGSFNELVASLTVILQR